MKPPLQAPSVLTLPGQWIRVRPRRFLPPIDIPLGILFTASMVINWLNMDLGFSARFYWETLQWFQAHAGWVEMLYRFGNLPAIVAASGGLIAAVGSLKFARLRRFSKLSVFLAMLLIIGPGVIVNAIFKEHYGRPRPREVVEFGGRQEFVPALQPNFGKHGHSFPSGHASMGFYFLGLFVYWYRDKRRLAWLFLGIGLVYGTVMGMGRIAQGAHWLSDVIWSGGLVYLTAWLLCRSGLHPGSSSATDGDT